MPYSPNVSHTGPSGPVTYAVDAAATPPILVLSDVDPATSIPLPGTAIHGFRRPPGQVNPALLI